MAVFATILASCVLLLTVALAAGSPAIERWVVASAGGSSASGGTTLHGTLGQPLVGLSTSQHASLLAGYEHVTSLQRVIYLPLVLLSH